ncbi:unnamed protein product [Arabis nemorensis]|uniref:Pectinesterase inhibitor domain-containing protein n=1 Tax=Arabis nemorensis TaxID=586526 RepID=A0A565AZ50_9BRAS|nr:unnamed protein product [Arabis nemorensis]
MKALALNTIGQIKQAYKTKLSFKHALDECNFAYKVIVKDGLPEADEALPGNPKFAEDGVADCKTEASICEDGFSKGQSPLTSSNQRMEKISDIARAIVRMLL